MRHRAPERDKVLDAQIFGAPLKIVTIRAVPDERQPVARGQSITSQTESVEQDTLSLGGIESSDAQHERRRTVGWRHKWLRIVRHCCRDLGTNDSRCGRSTAVSHPSCDCPTQDRERTDCLDLRGDWNRNEFDTVRKLAPFPEPTKRRKTNSVPTFTEPEKLGFEKGLSGAERIAGRDDNDMQCAPQVLWCGGSR